MKAEEQSVSAHILGLNNKEVSMIDGFGMNEWNVEGRIFYLKELQGEFGASVKIEGEAKRTDGTYSTQLLEVACLLHPDVYKDAKEKGIKLNSRVVLSGHLETWCGKKGKKVMFIADYIWKQNKFFAQAKYSLT